MSEVSRENFADEASWLTYLQHQAQLTKAQRLAEFSSNRESLEESRIREKYRAIMQKLREREYRRAWYHMDHARNPDKYRERARRERQNAPERYRQRHRDWRVRLKAERPEKYREYRMLEDYYRRIHRDRYNQLRLVKWRSDEEYRQRRLASASRSRAAWTPERRAQHQTYMKAYHITHSAKSWEERYASARAFAAQVIALRAEGWMFKEIAELTGRSKSTCITAYLRNGGQHRTNKRHQQGVAS